MELERVTVGIACAITMFGLDEEDILIIEGRKRRHRYWMLPYLEGRTDMTQRNTFSKLHRDFLTLGVVEEFVHTLRMPPELYAELLAMIYPLVYRRDTNWRKSIHPEERLDLTLRYLALGECARTLNQGQLVGYSSVLPVVRDTCAALYAVLRQEYMPTPSTQQDWLDLADGYQQHWQLPHCIGAVDGKHIRIRKPRKSGTLFQNYKKFFSVVLMAVVDAQYRFVSVDIGSEGKAGDSRIWKESKFGKAVNDTDNPLNIPPPSKIVGMRSPLPYYLVGDDAFSLSTQMMKPYPVRDQGNKQITANYRFSRGPRVVENSFGILATRFRLFRREQDMEPDGVKVVVLASCALHNFLRTRSGKQYLPPGSVDWEDKDHELHMGEWRHEAALTRLDRSAHDRNPPPRVGR